MEFIKYLEKIEMKLQKFFDIEKNYYMNNIKIDLLAKYFEKNERYILSKKAKIYGIENNEYCLIKHYKNLDKMMLEDFILCLKKAVDEFVHPHEEHMCSIVTGVIVVDEGCDLELIEMVKKFKYHKSFAFGLKGWVDMRLVLVTLNKGEVITNKKGREVQEIYQVV